jgi:hypothetical protein
MIDYHQDYSHHSQTMLKCFLKSRRAFHGHYVTKEQPLPPPTEDMKFGTLIHAGVFEPHTLAALMARVPASVLNKDGHRKGKPYTDWEASLPPDCTILTDDRYNALQACIAAVRGEIGKYIDDADAIKESVVRWMDSESGLKCRMKVDLAIDCTDFILSWDVKSSQSAAWDEFRKTSENLKYWMQPAHYAEGLRHHFNAPGKPVVFRFVAVQTVWPQWATTYPIDGDSLVTAVDARRRALNDLAACYESGVWCEPDEIHREPLVMRPWAFN